MWFPVKVLPLPPHSGPAFYLHSCKHKIHFTFILLHYQTLIAQNEERIRPAVFTSVQQTSITFLNSFQPSQFIFQPYLVSDYDIICT